MSAPRRKGPSPVVLLALLLLAPSLYLVRAWRASADSRIRAPFSAAAWQADPRHRLGMVPDLLARLERRELPADRDGLIALLGEPGRGRDGTYSWLAGVRFRDAIDRIDLPCTYLVATFDGDGRLLRMDLQSRPM